MYMSVLQFITSGLKWYAKHGKNTVKIHNDNTSVLIRSLALTSTIRNKNTGDCVRYVYCTTGGQISLHQSYLPLLCFYPSESHKGIA